jgi:hypothetical protein
MTPRICPWCGATFTPTHHSAVYCDVKHQHAFHDLSRKRGKVLLPLSLIARQEKNGKTPERTYARQQEQALRDRWNAEDKAAGRRPDVLVARKMAANWVAADLRRDKPA